MDQGFFLHPSDCEKLAAAQYIDMLNDTPRNEKYRQAIKKAVQSRGEAGPKLVVDIGTGTGLLSVMAAQVGAQKVFGVDSSESLTAVARKVVSENNLSDNINIACKFSTDIVLPPAPNADIPHKGDVCISEIVDSSLIGEGILPSLRHALTSLLEEDHAMVPYSAKVYGKLIYAPNLWKFQSFDEEENYLGFKFDEKGRRCTGSTEVPLELIWEDIEGHETIEYLTETLTLHEFQFSYINSLQSPKATGKNVQISKSGKCHGVMLWWDMVLDPESEFVVSTCPWGEDREWRNHWKQCVYFFNDAVEVIQGTEVHLTSAHDDFNLWFTLSPIPQEETVNTSPEVPLCLCGLHSLYRRSRIYQLNDAERSTKYFNAVKAAIERLGNGDPSSVNCLLVGDEVLIGLFAAKLGANVVSIDKRSYFRETKTRGIALHHLQEKFKVVSNLTEALQAFGGPFNLALSEPFYTDSQRIVEWHGTFTFWNEVSEYKQKGAFTENYEVLPKKCTIKAQVVEFDKFHRQFHDVEVPDINLEVFNVAMATVRPLTVHQLTHSLIVWQYKWKPVTDIFDLFSFNFDESPAVDEDVKKSVECKAPEDTTLHAAVIWVDYWLDDAILVSNAPVPGDSPTWRRQAVWMFPCPYETVAECSSVVADCKFDGFESKLTCNFY